MKHLFPILCVTGSDCAGKTGIQADIRTVSDLGGYALTAITCLTTVEENGCLSIHDIDSTLIREQLTTTMTAFQPKVAKVGLIRRASDIKIVRDEIVGCRHTVCSPGILSSGGKRLVDDDTLWAMKRYLLPEVSLLMLRCDEAEIILGMSIRTDEEMISACRQLRKAGAEWVLLRGGKHQADRLTALLYGEGTCEFFTSYNIEGWQRHGVGGALSSAIAARLALGDDMKTAIDRAHEYIHSCIVYAVEDDSCSPRSADVYSQFVSLVAKYYTEAHDVNFYADKLSVGTRYLLRVTRKVVGKTPKQIICEYIITEAKSLISTSRLPIYVIGERLGFSSQPTFCKFFMKHEGCSPSSIRQSSLSFSDD